MSNKILRFSDVKRLFCHPYLSKYPINRCKIAVFGHYIMIIIRNIEIEICFLVDAKENRIGKYKVSHDHYLGSSCFALPKSPTIHTIM